MALPLTGIYVFLVCAAGGLFTDNLWIQFGLLAVSSFLMMELNNVNALIRIYSRMVSCSYLMLAAMSHFLFVDIRCGIVQVCFVAFYLWFFSAYQDKRAVGRIFYAYLMLGIASTMFPKILYFVPVVWILMCTNIMAGSFRMFVASLMGLLVPYLFLGAYSMYIGNAGMITCVIDDISCFGAMSQWLELPPVQIFSAGFVALLAIVGMIHFRLNNYKDKIRTRMLFEVFSVMALVTIVLLVLIPQCFNYLLALLIVSTAPMIGHYIALTNTYITNLSFYAIVVVILFFTACNTWMLL